MTTEETRQLILDIAMNCHRMGNWIADDYEGKKRRIETFLSQTRDYAGRLEAAQLQPTLRATREQFLDAFERSVGELGNPSVDRSAVAERLMTWGNILTHRANLA